MNNVPDGPDVVNPQPGFYAIIPASVRYSPDLPPAAKLLFGEIVALTSVKGHCFAQNGYFSDLYGVDDRTIRRWLAALSQAGFIRIELELGTNSRRIFALAMTPQKSGTMVGQKSPPAGQKQPGGRTKTSAGAGENVRQSITGITKENNTLGIGRGAGFVGPGPVPARELREQEEKGSAPPPTVQSNSGKGGPSASKLRQVQRVVSLIGDMGSKEQLEQVWDGLHASGRSHVWAEAVERLKTMPGASERASSDLLGAFVNICEALP